LQQFTDDPLVSVCVATRNMAGVGLNLTAANVVVLLDPAKSLAEEGQAINRVLRLGQTRPVRVYRVFTRGTMEERLLQWRANQGELDVSPGRGEEAEGRGAEEEIRHRMSHSLEMAGASAFGEDGGEKVERVDRIESTLQEWATLLGCNVGRK
jgi:superfamily II DNA or RNA helicase